MNTAAIGAVFIKQAKDTIKNMQVFILFVVFPIIAIILTNAVGGETAAFFTSIFATMHCIFSAISATASILAEEKEKNTLRALIMNNVSAGECLFGIGFFVFLLTIITGSSFIFIGGMNGSEAVSYMLSTACGAIISIIIGMCIGTGAKSTTAVNGISIPVSMALAFIPMLGEFSKELGTASKFLYSGVISSIVKGEALDAEKAIVLAVSFVAATVLFIIMYRKNKSAE